MNRTSYKKYYAIFLLIILLLGIITGWYYYTKIYNLNNLNIVISSNKYYSFNIYHILFPLLSLFLSYLFIGPLIGIFSVFLEGFAISCNFILYTRSSVLKSSIFAIIHIIITRLIYLLLLTLLIIYLINIIINIIKKTNDFKIKYKYLKKALIVIFLILINEMITSTIIDKILYSFSLLIK